MSESEKKRVFLALSLSDELRAKFTDLMERLKKGAHFTAAHPQWVNPHGAHLTLQFFGDITAEQIKDITHSVQPIAKHCPPFEVQIRGLGVFPHAKDPRVIWIGVRKANPLFRLAEKIEDRLCDQGWPPADQEFNPHLTLARIKHRRGAKALMDVVQSHRETDLGPWPINHMTLYQSTLKPSGAEYRSLAEFPLQGRS